MKNKQLTKSSFRGKRPEGATRNLFRTTNSLPGRCLHYGRHDAIISVILNGGESREVEKSPVYKGISPCVTSISITVT